jgi:hypothetical protein
MEASDHWDIIELLTLEKIVTDSPQSVEPPQEAVLEEHVGGLHWPRSQWLHLMT